MFNVTVIRGKDIIKVLTVVMIIGLLFKLSISKISFGSILNKPISIDNSFVELGINYGSNIIDMVQKENKETKEEILDEEETFEDVVLKSVLELGSNAFSLKEKDDLGQDKENLKSEVANSDDLKEEEKIVEPAKTGIVSEVITQNPLKETYSQEYNGIKIKNETSIDLTDDILNPATLDIDASNVIIFHTHTCESYTQSEKFMYEATAR